jgi:glyoxylase-like metal-dependent hydrolase (beta-lactamase superfamily II)
VIVMEDTGRLYFRQLAAGRDFAAQDPLAAQMLNFVYLVGDRDTGDCVVIDPAYAIDELLALVAADEMHLAGVIATHYHPDHIGGSLLAGHPIEGVADLLERTPCPVHVQRAEVPWVSRTIGLSESELTAHGPGDTVAVGEVEVTLLHTPGHTPGSQCVLVDGMVLTGDTLFLDGCGRTDFPGGE